MTLQPKDNAAIRAQQRAAEVGYLTAIAEVASELADFIGSAPDYYGDSYINKLIDLTSNVQAFLGVDALDDVLDDLRSEVGPIVTAAGDNEADYRYDMKREEGLG